MPATFSDLVETVPPSHLIAALEQAADQLGTGLFAVRVDLQPPRIVFASAELARLLGRSVADILASAPWDLLAVFDRDRLRELSAQRTADAPPAMIECTLATADGRRLPIEAGVARVAAAGAVLAVGYVRDVSARVEAVAALQQSEQRFRRLIEGAPDGVLISRHGQVLFLNGEAARLLGLPSPEAGLGKNLLAMLPADEASRAAARMASMLDGAPPPPASDYKLVVDGQERVVEIKSIVVDYEGRPAVLGFARDATERHRLARDLERADRLAVIGSLAAAVAHEINNPLTYTHLSLEHVERELRQGAHEPRIAALIEHVRHARHGAERVATIVRDLRAFARVDDTPTGPIDITAVVDSALAMAENDLRHRARLVRAYAEVPRVIGSASRLEQVFLNLLVNAIQALPHGDPARDLVTVEIRAGGPGEVVVAVTDTGPGVPPELRDRIFEPFFTTKPAGEGTGLGLSVCRTILDSLGGRIALAARPGPGTRIEVTLREQPQRVLPLPPPVALPPASPRPRTTPVHVLIVDDEVLVLRTLEQVLAQHHRTTCAAGGAAALTLLDDPTAAFDVILCDVMMPGMTGAELHATVAARWPGRERRFVFMTGGAFRPAQAAFLDSVANPKLFKPFDVDKVLAVIRAAAGS